MPPVVAIAGPTASGKSALAVELAEAVGGEVVNADALQVYGGLHVLTARPADAEMRGVPHHFFGHVAPSRRYSVGEWTREVLPAIQDIATRGRTAVLVGGTGLYFTSLFKGLAEVPDVPETVRAELSDLDDGALATLARDLDPVAVSRLAAPDRQRLLRIAGVARATGRALSEWQADTRPLVTDWAGVVVEDDRDSLYARIEARFDAMLEGGGLDEVRPLAGLSRDLPALKAIGVSHLLRHLDGELTAEEAVSLAKRDTRRLAKRQGTWFRNQCGDWPRVPRGASVASVIEALAT